MNTEKWKFQAMRTWPLLASDINSLVLVPKKVDTLLATKRKVIYFNPDYIKTHEQDSVGLLLHEFLHIYLLHWVRGERLQEKFKFPHHKELLNVAADLEINSMLRECGISLPSDGLFPEKFNLPAGKTLEWYYENIKNQSQTSPEHGSAVTGDTSGEEDDDKYAEENEQEVRARVEQTLLSPGKWPGTMSQLINRILERSQSYKVPFDVILKRTIYNMVNSYGLIHDVTYSRPPRRPAIQRNIIKPGTVRHSPPISVVCDSSGSVPDKVYERFVDTINEFAAKLGRIYLEIWDAECVFSGTVAKMQHKRYCSGGTQLTPALESVRRKRPKDIIIVLTDGFTDWPHNPMRGIIVVCTTDAPTPDWVTTIRV